MFFFQRYNAIQAQELCSILNDSPEIRNYYRSEFNHLLQFLQKTPSTLVLNLVTLLFL